MVKQMDKRHGQHNTTIKAIASWISKAMVLNIHTVLNVITPNNKIPTPSEDKTHNKRATFSQKSEHDASETVETDKEEANESKEEEEGEERKVCWCWVMF